MPIPQVNDRIKEAPAVMLRAVFAGVGQLLLAADKVRSRAAESGWPAVPKSQSRGHSRWHSLDESRGGTVPLPRDKETIRKPPAPGDDAPNGSVAGQKQAAAVQASVTEQAPAPVLTVPARSVPMRPASAKQASKGGSAAKAKADGKAKAAAKAETTGKAKPAVTADSAATVKSASKAKPGQAAKADSAVKPGKPKPASKPKSAAKAKPVADTPPLPGYDDLTLPSLRARMRGFDVATLRAVLDYEKAHARRGDVITMFERRLAKVTAE